MPDTPFHQQSLTPLPVIDDPTQFGIAIIGAGSIVNSAHLPAYAAAGMRVAGIYDIDATRARATAAQFNIPRVYASPDELLADDDVQVIDVAIPPAPQETLFNQLAASGRHLLCQKPLAVHAADAQRMVDLAQTSNVRLGVNVNMRWSPAVRVLRDLIERQQIGRITGASIQVNFFDDWTTWPWLRDVDELIIRYDAIHLIDALRDLFGEAQTVYATASQSPVQNVAGETNVLIAFRYASGFTAFIHDSSDNWAQDTYAEFRVEGDHGIAKGLLGVWYDYPVGRADRIDFCSRDTPQQWHTCEPPGRWVPDAWAWTMAEMFAAVRNQCDPRNSGGDHVRTLRYVEAAHQSIRDNAVVALSL